jgi:hypothetical protein
MGALSSVMATAGAGLLPNPPQDVGTTIIEPTNIANAVSAYNNVAIVSTFQSVCSTALGAVSDGGLSQTNLLGLLALGSDTFPALTSVLPQNTAPTSVLVAGLTKPWDSSISYIADDVVSYEGNVFIAIAASKNQTPTTGTYWNLYLACYTLPTVIGIDSTTVSGNGDQSKFCQAFMAAQGYITQANATINSVKNSATLAETFTPLNGGMDNLTTGGLNQVTSNIAELGGDLKKLGNLIDLTQLDYWGLPGELLAQLGRLGNGILPGLSTPLTTAGLTTQQISSLGKGTNTLDAQAEKTAYTVMTKITGSVLSQVLAVFGVTTSNIVNMAQLLDPKIIMPTAYSKLLCPTNNGLVPIYVNGAANQNLITTVEDAGIIAYSGQTGNNGYNTLRLITPPDQALANKAFAQAMQQVKNVSTSLLPGISTAMLAVESNTGLTAVNNLTTPVPATVITAYQQQLGQGSGPNGTLVIGDILGVAYKESISTSLTTIANSVSSINSSALDSVYTNMSDTLAGTYGPSTGPVIITTGPGAGTYTDWNEAFSTALTPAAASAISTIASSNASNVTATNTQYTSVLTEVVKEITNQVRAQIDFTAFEANSTSTTMSFATNLHEYGNDPDSNDVLIKFTNNATLGGQSLLSSLREGRNIEALQNAGIKLDTQLDSAPGPVISNPTTPVSGWNRASSFWSRSSTLSNTFRNWGILRSWKGQQIPNWGSDGTTEQTGTVTVKANGTNVDVVIVDAVIDPAHPEFAVNADGTGGTRVKYYNWFDANIPGNPSAGSRYNPPITTNAPSSADDSRHACHVAGIAVGNTQGWAPKANIFNISPQYVTGGVQYLYLYQYILAWHNKKKATGNTNPTILNNSWYSRYTIPYTSITSVTYQGSTVAGPFTTTQLLNYGITNDGAGNCIVALQNSTMDAQIQACINAGIIFVGCAGNNDTRIATSGDADFNNTLTATGFNGGTPIYYARGSSPVATENVICVGAIRSLKNDGKASSSNCGPRVDLFAPGAFITSAWLTANGSAGQPTPVPDPRNTAYYIGKDTGTSMAAPQVTGILAAALEINPTMTQAQALSYIQTAAAPNQIPDTGGGYADTFSLQGAPNKYLALPSNLI